LKLFSRKKNLQAGGWALAALCMEDEASGRAMRKQPILGIGDTAFCCADTTAAVEDFALGYNLPSVSRDGSDERNLEFERGTSDAFFEHRLDG
jgi:cytolysin (calcineurin-like family phosphatase)